MPVGKIVTATLGLFAFGAWLAILVGNVPIALRLLHLGGRSHATIVLGVPMLFLAGTIVILRRLAQGRAKRGDWASTLFILFVAAIYEMVHQAGGVRHGRLSAVPTRRAETMMPAKEPVHRGEDAVTPLSLSIGCQSGDSALNSAKIRSGFRELSALSPE